MAAAKGHGRAWNVSIGSIVLAVGLFGGSKIAPYLAEMIKYHRINHEQAIADISTPERAAWYVDGFLVEEPRGKKSYNSFAKIHDEAVANSFEAAVAAAALLSDDGYPAAYILMSNSTTLELAKKGDFNYAFVYQQGGLYGAIGQGLTDGIQTPTTETLDGLVAALGYNYYNHGVIGSHGEDWISTPNSLVSYAESDSLIKTNPDSFIKTDL